MRRHLHDSERSMNAPVRLRSEMRAGIGANETGRVSSAGAQTRKQPLADATVLQPSVPRHPR